MSARNALFSSVLRVPLAAALLIPWSAVAPAVAADYYLASSGNDSSGNGSISKPWRTINQLNKTKFAAGDRILLQGGSTFTGRLYLSTGGRADAPITITSYGSGRATIAADTAEAIYVYNAAGIRITELNVTGPANSNNNGIVFYADLAGNVKLDSITIDSVEVSRFGRYGVWIGSWNGNTGYSNVKLNRVTSHDNVDGGISLIGYSSASNTGYAHAGVTITECITYNNLGRSGTLQSSGSGIVIGQVDGALIERSVSYNNGINNTYTSGPVGIWAWESNNVTIQYNESHHNRTSGGDGGGFDLDGGVTNSVMQYNYSHDNDGPGFLIAEYDGAKPVRNVIIRYNISHNDARKQELGAIHVWNGGAAVDGVDIYNNTVVLSAAPAIPKALMVQNAASNVRVRNNLLVTRGGMPTMWVAPGQTGFVAQANNYWTGGGSLGITYQGSTYADINAFRSATGLETLGDWPVGTSFDPMISAPDVAPTLGVPGASLTLTAYQLNPQSPLIDRGLWLPDFKLDTGKDFNGNPTPLIGTYDVGACESLVQLLSFL
jgi:hypothetical protein